MSDINRESFELEEDESSIIKKHDSMARLTAMNDSINAKLADEGFLVPDEMSCHGASICAEYLSSKLDFLAFLRKQKTLGSPRP